jgi:hypothetical protein
MFIYSVSRLQQWRSTRRKAWKHSIRSSVSFSVPGFPGDQYQVIQGFSCMSVQGGDMSPCPVLHSIAVRLLHLLPKRLS